MKKVNIDKVKEKVKVVKKEHKKVKKNNKEEKEEKRKWLLIVFLFFFVFFFGFSITYSLNEKFNDFIDDNIINTFKIDKPTSPKIIGDSDTWSKKELVRILKDAQSYSGIAYYEYCVTESKNSKNCNWQKTDSKNMVAATTGKFYVVFRGVSNKGSYGKVSNYEEVLIDNEAPTVKSIEIEEKNKKLKIAVNAEDRHSGIGKYFYKINEGEYKEVKKSFEIETIGKDETVFTIKVEDKLGNYKEISKVYNYEENKCNLNCDTNNDGKCDLNCDTNNDGKCDLNCDSNNDGKCDLNCDTNNDGKCDLNCDTNNDGKCDLNCDTDNDGKCDLNCDTNNDGKCDLNCDTNNDGKCDLNCDNNKNEQCTLNCDTNNDGKCDLNCDTDNDGKCDLNCDTNNDGKCDLNCDSTNDNKDDNNTDDKDDINKEEDKNDQENNNDQEEDKDDNKDEEEEIILPEINLDKVPSEFKQGEVYDLPSFVDFKGKEGTVSCVVRGKEYKDTSELEVGEHLIVCNLTTSDNLRIMVEKNVRVRIGDGEEEVWDGWVRLNLTYPENSTNWEWRLGTTDEIREGYNISGWQPYTGPILVKVEDVDDIYIRYDLNGETYIIAPNGKIAVDIEPRKYSLRENEETEVTIYYEKDVKNKEYRIDGGKWQEYQGTFKVTANQLIEARATKEEKVYDSDNNYLYTTKRLGEDSVFVGEYFESNPGSGSGKGETGGVSYEPSETPDGYVTKPTPGSKTDTYLQGPIISSNPSSELVESVKVKVRSQEVAEKIYVSVAGGKYQEYTNEIEVNKNCWIKAYYVRYTDGKVSDTSYYYVQNIKKHNKPYVRIDATPDNFILGKEEEVKVRISGSNYDRLEYSLDGVIYNEYVGEITITNSTTIYAKGTNSYGETIESLTIPTVKPPKEIEDLEVYIDLSPSKSEVEGLVNKTKVSITYDEDAEKKYYKIGYYGDWKEYTGSFEVSSNTIVYGYCTSSDGRGSASKRIDYLTTGISEPIIYASPIVASQQVKIEIDYDKTATVKRYQIGNGPVLDYNGSFYVYENTIITAYNKNSLGYEKESEYTVKNIVDSPKYTILEKGKYYIIKLNYPSESEKESREYKWKEDGVWKVYDSKGILLIKPEYKDEIVSGNDGIKVEDENGKEVIFKDHYYIIDVPLTELAENIFMRWDKTKIKAPAIIVNPNKEPTKEVDVSIVYQKSLVKKYYKIVKENLEETDWIEYEGPFKITENNVIVYAKGLSINDNDSEIGSRKITNIDLEAPILTIKGDFTTPKQRVTVSVSAKDNIKMGYIKYAKGEVDKSYFEEGGKVVNNPGTFKVDENGKYTIYAVDKLGNDVIEVIDITNIDKDAPNIIINVLTESYGTEAEVSIDYGDSVKKEYRIGETLTTYKTYDGNIILKANDLLNLANEDGTLTIYARGQDEAGNKEEVSEIIYALDLDAPSVPIINASSGYPILTEYGVELDQINYIEFDQTRDDVDNYYSLDDGKTWKIYTGPFKDVSNTIMAKSVKKISGLTITASKKVDKPADALGHLAFDGKTDTREKLVANAYTYLEVSEEMMNKNISVKYSINTIHQTIQFRYMDNEGKIIKTEYLGGSEGNTSSGTLILLIPEGTVKIGIYHTYSSWSPNSYIYEIRPYDEPVITDTKYYPTLTEYGVEQGYNEVTIDYFQTSVQRLYRINEGDWKNYQDKPIRLELDDVIEAKGIDKYGTETLLDTHTSVLPSDSLRVKAYDKDEDSSDKLIYDAYAYINISEEMMNKNISVKYAITAIHQTVQFRYMDKEGKIIKNYYLGGSNGETSSGTVVLLIPDGTVKIGIYHTYSGWSSNSYIYELREYDEPVISDEKFYPTLTEYGVEQGYNEVTIDYFQTSVQRLYRINDGEWTSYQDKPVRVELNDTLEAKGIDKYGTETLLDSHTSVLPSDSLRVNAYDKSEDTSDKLISNAYAYINISEEMVNKNLSVKYARASSLHQTIQFRYMDSEGTIIKTDYLGGNNGETSSGTLILLIPEGTVKIGIYHTASWNSYSYIYELRQYDEPVISDVKYYPTLTEYGVEQGYNEVTIDYFQTSVQRLYRINESEWKNYPAKPIRLELNDVIEAKGIDKNGVETLLDSHTSVLPSDSLRVNAYDNDEDSNDKLIANAYAYINISEEMVNKNLSVKYARASSLHQTIQFRYMNNEGTIIKTDYLGGNNGETSSGTLILLIPEGTVKIGIYHTYSWSSYSYIYEIKPSLQASLIQENTYSKLHFDSFIDSSIKLNIRYLSHLKQKLYSIDNGETWLEYKQPIEVNPKDVIKAKGIKEDGSETEISSYTVTAIADNLGSLSFDDKKDTYETVAKSSKKSFTLGEDTIGEKLRIFFDGTVSTTATITIYDKNDQLLKTVDKLETIEVVDVPAGSYKVTISAGSSALKVSEINFRKEITNNEVALPDIEIDNVDWTPAKNVVIGYSEGYINQYSTDKGLSWLPYEEVVKIKDPGVILARSIDNEGNVISSSSYEITKVDSFVPIIEIDIPTEFAINSEYQIPTKQEVGISGGSYSCKIGDEEITTTKDLEVGNYTVVCVIENNALVKTEVRKEINVVESINLANYLKTNNPLIEKELNFKKTSYATSDEAGLYSSSLTENQENTYYFRGDVKNNYVQFADLTWRVIRINEDGSIRMILNSGIENNQTYTYNSSKTIDTMYYNESEAKQVLEEWYQNNLLNFDNKIVNTKYCGALHSTVSGWSVDSKGTVYSSYNPKFTCEEEDKNYDLKIGLLTYDEAIFAGAYYNSANKYFYLYNNSYFWTMSLAGFKEGTGSATWVVGNTGTFNTSYFNAHNSYTLRPVINLDPASVANGFGTETNPYIIK